MRAPRGTGGRLRRLARGAKRPVITAGRVLLPKTLTAVPWEMVAHAISAPHVMQPWLGHLEERTPSLPATAALLAVGDACGLFLRWGRGSLLSEPHSIWSICTPLIRSPQHPHFSARETEAPKVLKEPRGYIQLWGPQFGMSPPPGKEGSRT